MPTLTEGAAEAPKATAMAKATLNGNCERHNMAIELAELAWDKLDVQGNVAPEGGG